MGGVGVGLNGLRWITGVIGLGLGIGLEVRVADGAEPGDHHVEIFRIRFFMVVRLCVRVSP